MDGVMRAVARGHRQSSSSSNLVHIEPGWGRAWERNPHSASVVGTGLGSMRNLFVIRSADLVVAVSGGSGTLSEMAIAWQEGKPLAALRSSGGWSEAPPARRLAPPPRNSSRAARTRAAPNTRRRVRNRA